MRECHATEISTAEIQPKVSLLFERNALVLTSADYCHHSFNILTQRRSRGACSTLQNEYRVFSWMTRKGAEETHYLDVVLYRILFS